jgi:serine/threonine-protein kinase
MGCVVAARHVELGELVAIKFLLKEVSQSEIVVARFFREARAAAKIKSEHVVRVSDVGRLPDGAPYMVMEHLNGQDLSDVLRDRGPLPIGEAVGYVLEACEALDEAHAAGIVHRDLKPSNLFLATLPDGRRSVKVLDFGIAKAMPDPTAGEHEKSLTATASVVGSPLYMSPEQVRSSKLVDARTDIWSLGVILHQLLTGRPPFDGETLGSVLAALSADAPPPLRSQRPDAPEGLERVLLLCLQKSPDARIADVRTLVAALAPYATFMGAPPKIVVDVTANNALATSATVATRTVGELKPAKSSLPLMAAAVAVLALAAGATGVAVMRKTSEPAAAAPPAPSSAPMTASVSAAATVVVTPASASASAAAPPPAASTADPAKPGRPTTTKRGDPVPGPAPVPQPVVPPPATPTPAKPLDVAGETRK